MLRWRLLLGTIFIAALAGLCWLDHRAATPGIWLLPLAALLSLLASQEMLGLLSARGQRPVDCVLYAGNLAIVLSNWAPAVWPDKQLPPFACIMSALSLAVLAALLAEMRRYSGPGHVMERLGGAMLGLCYVGLLLSFVCQLRLAGGRMTGIVPLATLVIVVKLCDVGAYTFGRLFGRHKMSPVLSPGKTIEGAIGGLALACLGAWLAIHWLMPRLSADGAPSAAPSEWGWLGYGLLVGTAGIFGDLAESMLKRDAGRKDSSTWMPGFGGVLDLLDSILFASPVAYLCWVFGLGT